MPPSGGHAPLCPDREPRAYHVGVFGWFDYAWPWIGLCFAAVLLVLLFATDLLRADAGRSRWQDTRWLSFLAVATYMVHNVEEYGISATGVVHAFPDSLCTVLGQQPYPACALPTGFYLLVNLPLVWVAAPLAAILAGSRLIALTLWGVIAVNAVVHIVPAIASREYDPGLLTATLLFLPLSIWTMATTTGRGGPFRRTAILPLLLSGVLMHGVLAGSAVLFLRGALPAPLLLALQPIGIALGYALVLLWQRRVGR